MKALIRTRFFRLYWDRVSHYGSYNITRHPSGELYFSLGRLWGLIGKPSGIATWTVTNNQGEEI